MKKTARTKAQVKKKTRRAPRPRPEYAPMSLVNDIILERLPDIERRLSALSARIERGAKDAEEVEQSTKQTQRSVGETSRGLKMVRDRVLHLEQRLEALAELCAPLVRGNHRPEEFGAELGQVRDELARLRASARNGSWLGRLFHWKPRA